MASPKPVQPGQTPADTSDAASATAMTPPTQQQAAAAAQATSSSSGPLRRSTRARKPVKYDSSADELAGPVTAGRQKRPKRVATSSSSSPAAAAADAAAARPAPARARTKPAPRRPPPTPAGTADAASPPTQQQRQQKAREQVPLPTRRNPKRKAAEAAEAKAAAPLPDTMLDEALAPVAPGETEEWDGWCEVESEPAFFNIILRDLGVKDLKVQELFSLDEQFLGFLPKPVFGLVFLFQYTEFEGEQERTDCPPNVWFANQTTDNACATVALFNIVMNAVDLELGEKLQEFKESTHELSPPLRGFKLSSNAFIRSKHNSFTRRLDLLNADLLVQNHFDEAKAKPKKRAAAKAKAKRQRKTKASEAGYHFIAYVPVGAEVWELDGLEYRPLNLGTFEGDWTATARPTIEARMLQYEEDQISFNLLALCRAPQRTLAHDLAVNLASLAALDERLAADETDAATPSSADNNHNHAADDDDSRRRQLNGASVADLAPYGLTPSAVSSAAVPASLAATLAFSSSATVVELRKLAAALRDEQARVRAEYAAEEAALAEDNARLEGRRRDYTPAIHEWLRRLARLDDGATLKRLVDEVA